jgi:hypothetical protein
VKAYIRDQERSLQQRFPDALACFQKCRESLEIPKDRKPWEKWEEEKDPRILGKTNFVTSRRYFGFASDDKAQFDELREQYEHIVFTDRENKPPAIPRVKDTLKVHSAANNPASRQHHQTGRRCSRCGCFEKACYFYLNLSNFLLKFWYSIKLLLVLQLLFFALAFE